MTYTWKDATTRWLEEMKNKRTIDQDSRKFRHLGEYLNDKRINDIGPDDFRRIRQDKEIPTQE